MSKYTHRRVNIEDITLEGEVWKDIPGFGDLYKISTLGRVYSLASMHILNVKPHKSFGYICMPLGMRKGGKSQRVHRLVAQAFIPNPLNKAEVNHKNKNRADNRVENLEWSTGMENTQHKIGRGVWNNHQNRITPNHSVARRKLKGFSNKIIPMIHKLVPLN